MHRRPLALSFLGSLRLPSRSSSPLYRSFHHTPVWSSKREEQIAALRKELGSSYQEVPLDVKDLLNAFRMLRAERALKKQEIVISTWYRDVYREIFLATRGTGQITIGEIEKVLTPENGVSWRAIRQLATKGYLVELKSLDDRTRTLIEFCRLHGIGKKRAESLYDDKGFRSFDDLRNAEFKAVPKATRIALDHLEDMETLILRDEIDLFKSLIGEALQTPDSIAQFEITGSYRRQEPLSSDIDMLVYHPDYTRADDPKIPSKDLIKAVSARLEGAGILQPEKLLASGDKKIMGLVQLPGVPDARYRQIDIRVCPFETLPYTLVGNTGDDTLQKILRGAALRRGWTLNEYGMGKRDSETNWFVPGTMVFAESEQEVFEHVGIPYLEPHQRRYKVYSKILPRRLLRIE